MTEFGSASAEFSDPIHTIGAKYPKVFSRFEVDVENETVVIGYDQSSEESERNLFFAEIEAIMAPFSYTLEFSQKAYNRHDIQTVSDELTTDIELWAPRFGNDGYGTAPDTEGDGVVRVSAEGIPDPQWSNFEHKGVHVVVEHTDAPVVTFQ